MKKTTLIIFIALAGILGLMAKSNYNGMVNKDENVSKSWSNVQTAYQHRADLVPNLVSTVKGYADHEKSTFETITNARSKANSVQVDASNLTPEAMQKFQAAQSGLSSALSGLSIVVERYPDLKANTNFRDLQSQLEGIENRITVTRRDFNEEVTDYNKSVRRFPSNIFASMFGFSRKATFESQAGSEVAPTVKFD